MLTIKDNVRKFKLSLLPLETENNSVFIDGSHIRIPLKDGNEVSYPNTFVFSREDGLWINHSEGRIASECENGVAVVAGFSDIMFKIIEREKISVPIIEGGEPITFLKVVLDKNHNYLKNRDTVYVRWYGPSSEMPEKICPGDYINYSGYFLHKINSVSGGEYDFSTAELQNYRTKVRFYLDSKEKKVNVLVPVEGGAKDIENTLLLYGDNEFIDDLAEDLTIDTFYGDDERFFVVKGDVSVGGNICKYAELTPNTKIMLRLGDPRIDVPLVQDFDTSLLQGDAISQFVESKSSTVINGIVDYEKQQFVPVFSEKDVEKILFRIHLRLRDEDWNTNDTLGWVGNPAEDENANSVVYMGFDEDDIYYQKKRVSETFLRVSFYTGEDKKGEDGKKTTDRRRQKLLYTAKIYLNSSDLYGKYVQNIEDGETDLLENIGTEFVCTQKYDYSNSTEGFYLHLFPGNLDEGKGEIFVKFELNNAKYGKTVPLVLFKNGFREGYMKYETKDGKKSYFVDMGAFNEDLYTNVFIRKNEEKGRYEWGFYDDGEEYGFVDFGADGKNTLTLQLVEPKINGLYGEGEQREKRDEGEIDEGGIIDGGGTDDDTIPNKVSLALKSYDGFDFNVGSRMRLENVELYYKEDEVLKRFNPSEYSIYILDSDPGTKAVNDWNVISYSSNEAMGGDYERAYFANRTGCDGSVSLRSAMLEYNSGLSKKVSEYPDKIIVNYNGHNI